MKILFFFRKTFVWWSFEDDLKYPLWQRVVFYYFLSYGLIIYPSSIAYIIIHRNDRETAFVLQEIALSLAGIAGIMAPLMFLWNRERITKLLKIINEKNTEILQRPNNARMVKRSNAIFLQLLCVWLITCIFGILVPEKFIFEFIKFGEIHFKTPFFVPKPFSVASYIVAISEWLEIQWMSIGCSSFVFTSNEILLRVCFIFDVTCGEIRQLRSAPDFDEEQEIRKLKRFSREYSILRRFVSYFDEEEMHF